MDQNGRRDPEGAAGGGHAADWRRDRIPVAELARLVAHANLGGDVPDDAEFVESVHWLLAMQAIERDPELRVIDEHSGQVVAGTAMAVKQPTRYAVTQAELHAFMLRHGFADPSPLMLAVGGKAAGEAALVAAAWPAPAWARWLEVSGCCRRPKTEPLLKAVPT